MSLKPAVQSPKLPVLYQKLPFVFSNFAVSADGKIAFANGEFTPFGSRRDREHMMELRATADAVMSGARTIELPGVTLGPGGEKYRRQRRARGLSEYNLRVIVSGSGCVNPHAEIFQRHFSPIILLTTKRIQKRQLRQLHQVADDVGIFGEAQVDFSTALRWLREKWNVRRLLCEGGGELHGALIRAGLVNELHLTICQEIFGGRTAPTIAEGPGFSHLAAAARFRIKSIHHIDNELFTVLKKTE